MQKSSTFPVLVIVHILKYMNLQFPDLNDQTETLHPSVIDQRRECKVPQDKCFLFLLHSGGRTIYHTWRQTQSNEENKAGRPHVTRVIHYTCLREVYNTSNHTSPWIL